MSQDDVAGDGRLNPSVAMIWANLTEPLDQAAERTLFKIKSGTTWPSSLDEACLAKLDELGLTSRNPITIDPNFDGPVWVALSWQGLMYCRFHEGCTS